MTDKSVILLDCVEMVEFDTEICEGTPICTGRRVICKGGVTFREPTVRLAQSDRMMDHSCCRHCPPFASEQQGTETRPLGPSLS